VKERKTNNAAYYAKAQWIKKRNKSLINQAKGIQKINQGNLARGAKVTAVPCLVI